MGLELITLRSDREIEAMRGAGQFVRAHALAASTIKPGVTAHYENSLKDGEPVLTVLGE